MKKRAFILAVLALLPAAAIAQQSADWTNRVTLPPIGGHVLGNPLAPTKLVEYVSYTCNHCADFVAAASAPLKAGWVKGGKTSVEVRNAVRDRYDLTAAMLARCGGAARFYGNHEALFANQTAWFPQIEAYEAAKDKAVTGESNTDVMKDIGRKTGLYALMGKRGFTPAQLDGCITNPTAMKQVLAMTDDAWKGVKITGTPNFTLNGKLLANTATWASLKTALPAPSAAPLPGGAN